MLQLLQKSSVPLCSRLMDTGSILFVLQSDCIGFGNIVKSKRECFSPQLVLFVVILLVSLSNVREGGVV